MAKFEPAYNTYILPNEGGYAKLVNDKGGRTYAGIAENYNKTWVGWPFIDFEEKKLKGQPVKNNTKWAHLQPYVDGFYRDRWNKNRFGEIASQDVANFLFDYHVHSQSIAIKAVQKLLGIKQSGTMDAVTLAAINKADSAALHDSLKKERAAFFETLYNRDPTQEGFRKGWTIRLSKFPTLIKENPVPVGLALAAVGGVALVIMLNKKKQTQPEIQPLPLAA